jgi:hypothetical protein
MGTKQSKIIRPHPGLPDTSAGVLPIPNKAVLEDMIKNGFQCFGTIEDKMASFLFPKGWGILYTYDKWPEIKANILDPDQTPRYFVICTKNSATITSRQPNVLFPALDYKDGIFTIKPVTFSISDEPDDF